MLVAHLIGGNEVNGIRQGTVIINGEELDTSYDELVRICGSISLGDLDTDQSVKRIISSYTRMVQAIDEDLDEDFVIDNHLIEEVSYSRYKVDIENKSLVLEISTYG